MSGLYSKYIKPIHFIGDIVVVNASFLLAYYISFGSFQDFVRDKYFILFFYYNLAWVATAYFLKGYQLYRVTGFVGIFVSLLRPILFYSLLVIAFNGAATVFAYSRYLILISFGFISAGIILWRLVLYTLLRIYRRSGYNYRKVVIAGFGDAALDLFDFFTSHPEHGYRFMGFFDDKRKDHNHIKGTLPELEKYCLENDIDEIYCLSSELNNDQLDDLIDFADKHFLRIKLVPDSLGLKYKNFKLDLYGYLPIISVRNIPLDDSINKIFKRSFDVVFSFLVCVLLLSWLLPILAIIIKLDSKGPIFFKQKRSGLNNDEFMCYKLRTMRGSDDAHIKQATKDDPRITPIGRFLRKYSLDELPQFFNVFIGNMSIVGPRPHMLKHTLEYSQLIEKYMLRHLIKPGITGLSQVIGFRGVTDDPDMMRRRVKMDIYYIENWSFFLDIRIVIQTVWNIFKGEENAG